MKKLIVLFGLFLLTSFRVAEEKRQYTIQFTADELQIVYDALGELPAKTSEKIRISIVSQVNEQNKKTQK